MQHETERGDIDHGFRSLHGVFIIFAEPAIPAEPRERSFHNPCQTSDLERMWPVVRKKCIRASWFEKSLNGVREPFANVRGEHGWEFFRRTTMLADIAWESRFHN